MRAKLFGPPAEFQDEYEIPQYRRGLVDSRARQVQTGSDGFAQNDIPYGRIFIEKTCSQQQPANGWCRLHVVDDKKRRDADPIEHFGEHMRLVFYQRRSPQYGNRSHQNGPIRLEPSGVPAISTRSARTFLHLTKHFVALQIFPGFVAFPPRFRQISPIRFG